MGTKIYSLIQCSLTVNECDWHILAGNDDRIYSHCLTRWTEVIAQDIRTYGVVTLAGTFTIELLSDMEFFLFQAPQSGHGMTWENSILYIRDLHGVWSWGGMEVTMVTGQRSMKQSQIDLANTLECRRAHAMGGWPPPRIDSRPWLWKRPRLWYPSPETWGIPEEQTFITHRKWSEPWHQNRPCVPRDLPVQKITTLPANLLSLNMRVRGRKVLTPTLPDILRQQPQCPITIRTTHSVVILRTVIESAGIRSIVTGERVVICRNYLRHY